MAINKAQLVVFSLTFLAYALYHSSRKNLSGVKASVVKDWLEGTNVTNGTVPRHKPLFDDKAKAEMFLGTLDAVFMISYAISMFVWGILGDRTNPKRVVIIGMIGSGITLLLFGTVPYVLHFYTVSYYIAVYTFFGLFQACGWPNLVAIMGNWFSANNRGFVLGIWAANASAGNIIGAYLVSFVLALGYEYTFAFNSAIIVLGALAMHLWVPIRPKEEEARYEEIADEPFDEELAISRPSPNTGRPITLKEAILLPNVLAYCCCIACLKLVNYAFFFWLPYYLSHKHPKWSEAYANQLSAWFDLGGIIGSIAGGILSDRLGHRSLVILVMLLTSLATLVTYLDIGDSKIANTFFMTSLGITIAGPFNLITGVVSIDLGSQPALAENSKAMSTVSGLINGVGSAGAAFGQLLVPAIQSRFGWSNVFYMFIIMNTLSILCLAKRCYEDLKDVLRPYLRRHRGHAYTPVSMEDETNEHAPLLQQQQQHQEEEA